MDNILSLHQGLKERTYGHGGYQAFNISDPKPRNIHKALVRDRLLHHAIYRALYPFFDKKFIADSYSCRVGKGTHKAFKRFKYFSRKVSKNNTKQCFILKCDIRKFFASIDHKVLLKILFRHIEDKDTLWLMKQIIRSFSSQASKGTFDTGLPLGNLTSQLLVNVYMNEFDRFVKRQIKAKHYIRYADDFILLSHSKTELENNIRYIECYLKDNLKLELHPDKVFIKTLSSGVDFLGWVHFPHHMVLRTVTNRRMVKRLAMNNSKETKTSYLGMLKWGNAHKLKSVVNLSE